MALYKTKHINNYTYKDNTQYVHTHLGFKMVKNAIKHVTSNVFSKLEDAMHKNFRM